MKYLKEQGKYLGWQRGYILTYVKNSTDFQIKNSRKMCDNSHCLHSTIQVFFTIILILVQFWWVAHSLVLDSSYTQ